MTKYIIKDTLRDEYMDLIPESTPLKDIIKLKKEIINKEFRWFNSDRTNLNDYEISRFRDDINNEIQNKKDITIRDNLINNIKMVLLITIIVINSIALLIINVKSDDSIETDGNKYQKFIYGYYKHWILVPIVTLLSVAAYYPFSNSEYVISTMIFTFLPIILSWFFFYVLEWDPGTVNN
jgi:hypothetical protein